MEFVIQELIDDYNLETFECQNEDVNDFLNNFAFHNQLNLLSKVYILVDITQNIIAGYLTLSSYLLRLGDTRYEIPKVPSILLGRIGIDNKYRGKDLAKEYLIPYAIGICNEVKEFIGCRLLIAEVEKGANFKNFLEDNGFCEEKSNTSYHYMSLDLLGE